MRSDQILARTMKYGDELTLLELGKKVEREQFIEDTYNPFSTMTTMLRQRVFSKLEDVRRWNKRSAHEERFLYAEQMAQHGPECPCDACNEAVKRLLIACGVLPRGSKRGTFFSMARLREMAKR